MHFWLNYTFSINLTYLKIGQVHNIMNLAYTCIVKNIKIIHLAIYL